MSRNQSTIEKDVLIGLGFKGYDMLHNSMQIFSDGEIECSAYAGHNINLSEEDIDKLKMQDEFWIGFFE
jgi:hypothetical protein